jgi:hypothetical protein
MADSTPHTPPLAGYDELSVGDLRHRIRSLSGPQLHELAEWERQHADRVAVLQLIKARQDELDEGAEPTQGDPANTPGRAPAAGGSPVEPQTGAEPTTPSRHGMESHTPNRSRP